MRELFKIIYKKINRIRLKTIKTVPYDFNILNPLGGNGERVDIQMNAPVNFKYMDIYQKNHWKRYEFANKIINTGDVCGDFACGTGYGSILIANKANAVIGMDLNATVIDKIRERYITCTNVNFIKGNLLKITYIEYFDVIISFETLEHFSEENIQKLLSIFYKALKGNGKLIFSTPYMQEESDSAIKAGFHLTFYINEEKIMKWMEKAGFTVESLRYQNYEQHLVVTDLQKKEFIVGVARKISK